MSVILKKCGLTDNDFTIKFSSRKILENLLDLYKITVKERRLKVLRSLDKVDRLGWEAVEKLLGPGRKDESGDFTEGADLPEDVIDDLQSQLKYDDEETFTYAAWSKERGGDAYNDIKSLEDNFKLFDLKNIRFDPTLIRGLEYYTGPIFEVNINFDIKNSKFNVFKAKKELSVFEKNYIKKKLSKYLQW